MANTAWTSTDGRGVKFHTATVNASNAATAILSVNPQKKISITIDIGTSETLNLYWSTAQTVDSTSLLGVAEISADYENYFSGPITGLRITGGTTNASTIHIIES